MSTAQKVSALRGAAKIASPRKIRVTVTVEEFDHAKANDTPSSKEFWVGVGSFLTKKVFNLSNLRRLFSWIF